MDGDAIRKAAEILAGASHAIALTGAGVSTASGIPDFRGPRGLWRLVDPELFSIDYFHADPLTVWRHYASLYRAIRGARPNPSHYALSGLEAMGVVKAVITQNIDGLHQKAGSRRVVELHGNAFRARCTSCGAVYGIEWALEQLAGGTPRCSRCGGLLKPDVVFFGEPLPMAALNEALRLAFQSDAILVAGSSLAVSPANRIPVIVKRRGGKLVIVNMGATMLDGEADVKIEGATERALPAICKRVAEIVGSDKTLCTSRI